MELCIYFPLCRVFSLQEIPAFYLFLVNQLFVPSYILSCQKAWLTGIVLYFHMACRTPFRVASICPNKSNLITFLFLVITLSPCESRRIIFRWPCTFCIMRKRKQEKIESKVTIFIYFIFSQLFHFHLKVFLLVFLLCISLLLVPTFLEYFFVHLFCIYIFFVLFVLSFTFVTLSRYHYSLCTFVLLHVFK